MAAPTVFTSVVPKTGLALIIATVLRAARDTTATITFTDDGVSLETKGKTQSMRFADLASIRTLPNQVLLVSTTAEILTITGQEQVVMLAELGSRIDTHEQRLVIAERLRTQHVQAQALKAKPIYATNTLAAVMVIAFAAEWLTGALSDLPMLLKLGAGSHDLIVAGQLNRLVTANFLHGSFLHLLMNFSSLVVLSGQLERYAGWARLLPIVFISFVLGTASGIAFHGVLVGMSTGLYGLLGAAAVTTVTYRNHRLEGIWLAPRQWVQLIVVNGLINVLPVVSFSAHFGGFIGGVIGAALFLKTPSREAIVSDRVAVVCSVVAIALTLAAFAATAVQALN